MKSALAGAAATVAIAVSLPVLARAAPVQCADREGLVADLKAQFEERQKAVGLTAEGKLIEVFAADDGTWTMLLTTPDSVSCIVTHGVNWLGTIDREKKGELPSAAPWPGIGADPRGSDPVLVEY